MNEYLLIVLCLFPAGISAGWLARTLYMRKKAERDDLNARDAWHQKRGAR